MNQGWDQFWQTRQISKERIRRNLVSDRWKIIEKTVKNKYSSFDGKKVLEVGAGLGTMSMCMALHGAQVTLLDYESSALEQAEVLFSQLNLKLDLLHKNIFDPPDINFRNIYDIVMSFGLVEHFEGKKRRLCLERHFNFVAPGGIVIVSVPNSSSFLIRLDRIFLSLARKWKWGWKYFSKRKTFDWAIEIPFSKRELENLAKTICPSFKIYVTNFGEAINALLRWIRYPLEAIGLKTLASKIRWTWAPMYPFDRIWGASLVLIANKGESQIEHNKQN